MGKFKGVLFDFDGTIMDTNEIILGSWRHVYQTLFQRDPDYKEITWTFGEPLSTAWLTCSRTGIQTKW